MNAQRLTDVRLEYKDCSYGRSLHMKIRNLTTECVRRGKLSHVKKLKEIIHKNDKNIW